MARFAALLLLTAIAPSDVTPKGPPPIVGSTAVIGAYTLYLQGVRVGEDGKLKVALMIVKRDRDLGDLHIQQVAAVGGRLGFIEGVTADVVGASPEARRKLQEVAKPVEFDTQATLLSFNQHPAWTVKWCNVVEVPDGPGCLDLVHRRVPVVVNEIVIQERNGNRITLRAGSAGPMPKDKACTLHGGRIRARSLSDAEKSAARAAIQLTGADDDWKSRNPEVRRAAREAYRNLLKEYPSESVVTRNLERIKARAEAEIEE